jgi:hypothetical protein
MIDGTMGLIEGSKKLAGARNDTGDSDHVVFIPLRGVASDSDHFEIGKARNWCNFTTRVRVGEGMTS